MEGGKEIGPAEKLGFVMENDIIAGIDGEEILGSSFANVVAKIKAASPDEVKLTLLRPEPSSRLRVRSRIYRTT